MSAKAAFLRGTSTEPEPRSRPLIRAPCSPRLVAHLALKSGSPSGSAGESAQSWPLKVLRLESNTGSTLPAVSFFSFFNFEVGGVS